MFNKIISASLAILLAVFTLTGCDNSKDEKKLVVGVAAGPYGDMFKQAIAPGLEQKGYKIEIREFSDYVQPNIALANKDIDINLFQHLSYLNNFKQAHNLDITAVAFVPTAGAGIFSNKITNFSQLKAGDQVTIANDVTNEARALRILQAAGLITLNPSANPAELSPKDIIDNPHELMIVPIEAPQTPRSLDSATLAVVNGNYAIGAGLDLSKALYSEVLDKDHKNVIAIRTSSVDTLGKDIIDVVSSEQFNQVINDKNGMFYTFQKPNYQLY
ncbi:D-methionine transport system substrate-binding protein [Orbus hercynius]|uniref:D-methionine transport system substrate-binding protein n=1 Tax=Orbus hercynius TaxID=593135 RepID=A0A495RBB1_9GAMM|nr:MetQ/NlpA family ABC transporter substrate-binding protein [Orbus hercynius]RKS84763.1 D-methionine transport system substrate-binding protein [Orbus hercynius]